MKDLLLGLFEVARLAGVNPTTIRHHRRAGNLPCVAILEGNLTRFRYRERDVKKWLKAWSKSR